jgi:transposase InsO family protein
MCKVLKVSRSGYYKWLKGGISRRKLENRLLLSNIKEIFDSSRQTYGSPRISKALERIGIKASKVRVAKLMRTAGLKSKVRKKYRIATDSNHKYPIANDYLKRDFTPNYINKAWVSDITYIRTKQGWMYLTVIMDLFDRQIIGWSLSSTMRTKDTVIPAWRMAISKRRITSELIFHSDRGIQYACNEFKNVLKANVFVKQSMSRKANCWDNAVAESFFKTLKTECVYQQRYNTVKEAEISVFEYIEIWYNRKRLHSSLGYKTPAEYEAFFFYLKNVA